MPQKKRPEFLARTGSDKIAVTIKGSKQCHVILCLRGIICIPVETVSIRIVGDDHMEFTQGRPFGFEVECVTADGEPITQGQLMFVFLQCL